MDFTVVVVTHNRAELLRDTLRALSQLSYAGAWETLVVDNNSTDATRDVVARARPYFPVLLRYLFEARPGKYNAFNAGIRVAEGAFIAATDDDAYPERDWLHRAAEGFAKYRCEFVGGPVYPAWRATPPRWVNPQSALCGKVLGLQDHGREPREYGCRGISWPLGVNVAYRRDVFDRTGLFDGRLGRIAGTLRNQSQREWHLRARAAGVRGMYVPGMVVHHSVEAERLTRRYFYRWFYWHGISRAILNEMTGLHLLEPEGDATHHGERDVLGLPVSLWTCAARSCVSAGKRRLCGRSDEALDYELMVSFCAGVLRHRFSDLWHVRGRTVPRERASAETPPMITSPKTH